VRSSIKPTLPVILSLTAGFVDTAGFLALQGLFTSHVTGNFVTLGAALVFGTSGAMAKLLALPTFCFVIFGTRYLSHGLAERGLPVLRTILSVQVILLTVAAALAIGLGPFSNGDSWSALVTGLTLVSAMAIQNAAHRVHLVGAPPTTIMTGNATQMMIDLADLLHGEATDAQNPRRARLVRMTMSVIAFAAGCAAAALIFSQVGILCFLVPPVLGLCTLMFRLPALDGDL
jgi:uncharacterized membrane protein YoaK (UPF0700 family)